MSACLCACIQLVWKGIHFRTAHCYGRGLPFYRSELLVTECMYCNWRYVDKYAYWNFVSVLRGGFCTPQTGFLFWRIPFQAEVDLQGISGCKLIVITNYVHWRKWYIIIKQRKAQALNVRIVVYASKLVEWKFYKCQAPVSHNSMCNFYGKKNNFPPLTLVFEQNYDQPWTPVTAGLC